MSAKLLLGKEVSAHIKQNLSEKIIDLRKKNIIDQLNLKYKPIESYTAFSNFLPRKKL